MAVLQVGAVKDAVMPLKLRSPGLEDDPAQDTSGCESSGGDVDLASNVEDRHTNRAVLQAKEVVGLEPYQRCRGKPMVEMEAGSRLYYQATVTVETRNELKLVFPACDETDAVREEWVKKSSSRIWRGSLSRKVWKHKGRGAWEPKETPKSRGKKKGCKRKASSPLRASNPKSRPTDTDDGTFDENDAGTHEARRSQQGGAQCVDHVRFCSNAGANAPESLPSSSAFEDSMSEGDRLASPGHPSHPMDALVAWFHAHIIALKGKGAMNQHCVPACGPLAPLIRTKHFEATCRAAAQLDGAAASPRAPPQRSGSADCAGRPSPTPAPPSTQLAATPSVAPLGAPPPRPPSAPASFGGKPAASPGAAAQMSPPRTTAPKPAAKAAAARPSAALEQPSSAERLPQSGRQRPPPPPPLGGGQNLRPPPPPSGAMQRTFPKAASLMSPEARHERLAATAGAK